MQAAQKLKTERPPSTGIHRSAVIFLLIPNHSQKIGINTIAAAKLASPSSSPQRKISLGV